MADEAGPEKSGYSRTPWWVWLVIAIFPIALKPWWLAIMSLAVFALVVWILLEAARH
jgi:hypothetical protein